MHNVPAKTCKAIAGEQRIWKDIAHMDLILCAMYVQPRGRTYLQDLLDIRQVLMLRAYVS